MKIAFLAGHPELRDTLAAWHLREWPSLFTPDHTPWHEFDTSSHRDRLDCTLIGLVDGRLAASAALLAEDVLPLPDCSPWLGSVVVDPALRGHGLGRQIVLAAMEHAHALGIPELHLWTPSHRTFYEKLGWTFVRDYEDEIHRAAILRFLFPSNPA